MRFITLADLITRLYIRKRAINRITVTAEVMMIEEKQLNCDLTWTAVYECYKQDFTIPLNPFCQLITMSNSNCILLPPKCDPNWRKTQRLLYRCPPNWLYRYHTGCKPRNTPNDRCSVALHLICCLWWLMVTICLLIAACVAHNILIYHRYGGHQHNMCHLFLLLPQHIV